MREFNLEEAKAGKPVCTRDGRNARIICYDRKEIDNQPILALVEDNGNERIRCYDRYGNFLISGKSHELDLFMKTITHKGFAWVSPVQCIYGDETEARYNKSQTEDGYFLAKIEWEE